MLGVPYTLIQAHGAVSEPVVAAMANGALQRSGASIAIGTESKTIESDNNAQDDISVITRLFQFDGDRELVREQAALEAILVSGSLLGV